VGPESTNQIIRRGKGTEMQASDYQTGVLQTASCDKKKITNRFMGFVEPPPNENIINLLHSILGVTSEVGELLGAETDENVIEELGDLLWYTTLGIDALGEKLAVPSINYMFDKYLNNNFVVDRMSKLFCLSAELSSIFKAFLFYGREIKKQDVLSKLKDVSELIFAIGYTFSHSPRALMEKNQKKLLDKEKGRYKSGSFSEDSANVRDVNSEYEAMRLVEGKDD